MNTSSQRSIWLACIALLLCAVIWGGGFVFQKSAMAYLPPLLFNAMRCLISAGILMVLIVCLVPYSKSHLPWMTRDEWVIGANLGVLLWMALGCQQVGIAETTAFRTAFITGLYVTFVPFVTQALMSKSVSLWQVSMTGLAGLGVFLLTSGGSTGQVGLNRGDLWVMLSSIFWAVHVTLLGRVRFGVRILHLACVQMMVCSVLSGCSSWLVEENWRWPIAEGVMWALIYAGVLSGVVAYVLQIYGQSIIAPPVAALLLSLEALIGGGSSWYFLQESFSARNLVGAMLIMLLIGLVEMSEYLKLKAKRREWGKSS